MCWFSFLKHVACSFLSFWNLYLDFSPQHENQHETCTYFVHGTCCFLFVELVLWWFFVHETCCTWIFLCETCILIFLIVKLILFMKLVVFWLMFVDLVTCKFCSWNLFYDFFCETCTQIFSPPETDFVFGTFCELFFIRGTRCGLIVFVCGTFCTDFCSWNILNVDFSLLETSRLTGPRETDFVYGTPCALKIFLVRGTCCVLISVRETCKLICSPGDTGFIHGTCWVLIFFFVKPVACWFLFVKLVACWLFFSWNLYTNFPAS